MAKVELLEHRLEAAYKHIAELRRDLRTVRDVLADALIVIKRALQTQPETTNEG